MALSLSFIEHPAAQAETAAPLVVAHGLFGSARNFNTLGKTLATNRRVILLDMRNHGTSPWDDDVSYPSMADDLAGAVERLAGGKAYVLGHSMGGKATMALALNRPELLSGAIIADIAPAAYAHTHLPYIQAMRAIDLTQVRRRSDAEPGLAAAIPEPMLRAFLLQNLVIEEGQARWRLNLRALEEGMPALIDWPAALDTKRFTGPALFLSGGASAYMTKAHEPHAQALFPMAEFHAIPGAGHWLHAEKPGEFLASITDWLASVE